MPKIVQMELGLHSLSRAAVATALVLLSAGKAQSGVLDCGLGDVQIVLPGESAQPKSPASVQAQVQIRCKQVPDQNLTATPKALSTYPTNTPRGQVTWSNDNGKPSSIHNTSAVIVDSRGFTAR